MIIILIFRGGRVVVLQLLRAGRNFAVCGYAMIPHGRADFFFLHFLPFSSIPIEFPRSERELD